jgi:LacI family transcriptional regulator
MTGRFRLADIAELAHVSVATVSRVINNEPGVSSETRERVLRVAAFLNISFKTKALIGLIIPDALNPYFASLGFVFQRQLDRLGKHVLMASSEQRPEKELALVNSFKGLGLEGLIYIAAGHPSEMVLEALADDNVPVVVFDRRIHDGNLDCVALDNRIGIERAVDYLVTLGHTNIGHIAGLEGTRTATERLDAFRDAMNQNRLEVDEDWIWRGSYQFPAGIAVAETLLNTEPHDRPTAVLCANDAMAMGLMQRLQQGGWSVPRDLSVMGFDNITMADCVFPRLTTVDQPLDKLAFKAIELLTERIRHHEQHPNTALAPRLREVNPVLIPRDSTAEPPRRPPAAGCDEALVVPLRSAPMIGSV